MLSNLPRYAGLLFATLSLGLSSLLLARPASDWKGIAPGMDLRYVTAKKNQTSPKLCYTGV